MIGKCDSGEKNKKKPLPPHTKIRYSECRAKIILEDIFFEQLGNLELRDKPDLQSFEKDIGIEVVIAENQNVLKAERIYSYLSYDEDVENRQRKIDSIEECDAKYINGILYSSGYDNFNLINKAVKKKIENFASKNYKQFKENHLFVFSSIYADDSMLRDELVFLQSIDLEKHLKKIYVLFPDKLCCFDLERATYEKFAIDSKTQMQYALEARKCVEEKESSL